MDDARASLLKWLELRGGSIDDYAFPSRTDHTGHMSTRQYARLVDEWVTGTGLPSEDYGTHSMQRTKASIIYKATGNLRAVDRFVDLNDIREKLRPFHSKTGRPSIDPDLIIRMLLIGYCLGIRSERRLCEEVHLNLPIYHPEGKGPHVLN